MSTDLYANITSDNIMHVWNSYKALNNLQKIDARAEKDILVLLKMNNLNPFKKEAFIVPFRGSYTVVIAYQTLMRRAYEAGYDSKQFDFKINKTKAFQYNSKNQLIEIDDLECVASLTTTDNRTYSFSILFSEYRKPTPIWQEKPMFMLKKCAIACLFRTLPNTDLGALPYTREELID